MKTKKLISSFIFIISLATLLFAGFKIISYHLETARTNTQISALEQTAEVEEIPDPTPENVIEAEPEAESTPEVSLYWRYLNTPLLSVNLPALIAENSDTVGWLQVLGTNVNYPFVQTADNRYYLYHSFDRSYNNAGWVFLDYRNSKTLSSQNNIIYAHGRTDKTMFGTLKNLLSSAWINSPESHLIRTVTENSSSVWAVFSVYIVPTTSDYLQTNFADEKAYSNFLELISARSAHDFAVKPESSDQILTLSTRYDDEQKLVIHAKLLKSSAI